MVDKKSLQLIKKIFVKVIIGSRLQSVSKKAQHKDFNYFCFKIPLDVMNQSIQIHMTKYLQLAIIQAFTLLWEIKLGQIVVIRNFVSEDKSSMKISYQFVIEILKR